MIRKLLFLSTYFFLISNFSLAAESNLELEKKAVSEDKKTPLSKEVLELEKKKRELKQELFLIRFDRIGRNE